MSTRYQRVLDDFDRANGGLGANWTSLSGFSDTVQIVSNECKCSNSSGSGSSYYSATAWNNQTDAYSEVTVGTLGQQGVDDGGPTVRSNGVDTFYVLDLEPQNFRVVKCVGGVFSLLNSVANAAVRGDVCWIEVQGITIKTYKNGALVNNLTDTAINGTSVGGPEVGVYVFGVATFMAWAAGDFLYQNRPPAIPNRALKVGDGMSKGSDWAS